MNQGQQPILNVSRLFIESGDACFPLSLSDATIGWVT
jgi:hypothetical protein